MNRSSIFLLFIISICIVIFTSSCRKFNFIDDANASIEVSRDSILFDTVFTTMGSATRSFKIYNPYEEFLRLDKVELERVAGNQFQMNVDGQSGTVFENIEIAPGDSVYVFVNVTINPDLPISESPFIIQDHVKITNGTSVQRILVEAWGQNANYFPGKSNRKNIALLTCNMGTLSWDDPKPYVIHGVLLVDSCTIHIPAGQRVYIFGGIANFGGSFYGDGQIQFFQNGKLIADGSPDNRIIIEGTRLEPEYRDDWGQWERIQFSPGSTGNSIRYTDIRDGNIGLFVDSLASLRLEGVKVYNNSTHNLLARHGEVIAENCIFHTSGDVNVSLNFGGNYDFKYCTLVNHKVGRQSLTANNFLCIADFCNEWLDNPLTLNFTNSIITGSSAEPIQLQDLSETPTTSLDVNLDHTLYKLSNSQSENNFAHIFQDCNNCYPSEPNDTIFLYPDSLDFRLDTMSIARDRGRLIPSISTDILGQSRDMLTPDLGCYEFIE